MSKHKHIFLPYERRVADGIYFSEFMLSSVKTKSNKVKYEFDFPHTTIAAL